MKQVEALKALKAEEEIESIEGLFPKNMRNDEIKNGQKKLNEKI